VKEKDLLLQKRLGSNISARRKYLNWTQEFLAHQIEVDTETISRIERGVTCPSLKTVSKLSDALAISIAELLDQSPPAQPSHIEVIARLLEPLNELDRTFVLGSIRSFCHHFLSLDKSLDKGLDKTLDKTLNTNLADGLDKEQLDLDKEQL